jgi:hypothetical protein
MSNPNDIKNPQRNPSQPTDQGEDSEERRDAADKAWRDRERVQPEVEKPEKPDDVDDIDEKR